MKLTDVVKGDKSLNVTDDITGGYIATILKPDTKTLSPKNRPKDQVERIIKSLQDEFSMENIEILEVEDEGNGITFVVSDEENDIKQSIRLLTAWIY